MRVYVSTTAVFRKKLKGWNKVYSYYTISGIIRIRSIDTVEQITLLVDLKNMFPNVDIVKLWMLSILCFSFLFIC